MAVFSGPLQSLIDELGRLPGVGPKSAQRITFHLLKVAPEDALRLAEAIIAVKERITLCTRCFNVAEGGLCAICTDDRRDTGSVCVVEDPRDIVSVEKTGEFAGKLPRPAGGPQPDRRHRARSAAGPRAAGQGGRGGDHRGDPLHQPQPRGRGHRHVPGPPAEADGADRHPDRQRACRWAATSSTPTS